MFPRLQPIWSEVRDLFPREGLAVATERLSAEENSLQLLGLSMSERVALILAFPGMIFLMLFLLSNLLSLAAGEPEDTRKAIAAFPIVLFQSNVLARLLSAVSLVIFPTIGLVILWFRTLSGPEEPLWQFWVFTGASVTVFLISVQVLRLTELVRKSEPA